MWTPHPWHEGKMCDQAMKYSTNQVHLNSSSWYPITTQEKPGLIPMRELTLSLGEELPAKDPSPSCWEGGGIVWSSAKAPKLGAYQMDGMAGGQLNNWHEAHPYLKQWEEQPFSSILAWAMNHHQEAHMPPKCHALVAQWYGTWLVCERLWVEDWPESKLR